jgi:hypothetical protein
MNPLCWSIGMEPLITLKNKTELLDYK